MKYFMKKFIQVTVLKFKGLVTALVRAVLALPYDRQYHSMSGRHHIAQDTQERLRRGQAYFFISLLLRTIKTLTNLLRLVIPMIGLFPTRPHLFKVPPPLIIDIKDQSFNTQASKNPGHKLPQQKTLYRCCHNSFAWEIVCILCSSTGNGSQKTRPGFFWMYPIWSLTLVTLLCISSLQIIANK